MEYVKLNNGVEMPKLGFGVYQIRDLDECEKVVADAIRVGYRLFDTAQRYHNEEAVGNAIVKSGISRKEFFITTKVWIHPSGEKMAYDSVLKSMKKLQTDYLDLVLVHQPFGDYYGTYRALEKLYQEGKVRAIGVSNFYPDRLIDLIRFHKVIPMVNQIETHPFYQQEELKPYLKQYNIQHESWGPFAEGKNNIFENSILKKIGEKYQKSVAQVILKFFLQQDIVVIPKTVHLNRMKENFDVFDFMLTDEDIQNIKSLDQNKGLFYSLQDPSILDRFLN